MRSLSACLCAVDGMTVMHNLECGENMLCSLSGLAVRSHPFSIYSRHCFLEEPDLNTPLLSVFSFFFFLLSFTLLQMSQCTIVVFLPPVPCSIHSPCSLGLVLWVQRMSRLRSSRLTTSRPLARINLSPLFLPVEQD